MSPAPIPASVSWVRACGDAWRLKCACTCKRAPYGVPQIQLRPSGIAATVIRLLASLALTVSALTLPAQSRARPAADSHRSSIRGIVRDSLGSPVDGASVSITPGGSTYRTDDSGTFVARRLPSGRVTISVRRLGFAPIRSSASLKAGNELTLNLLMRRLPQLLPEVKISENECPRFAIEGILCRRKRGVGVFMNREEIQEKREGIQLVNLLLRGPVSPPDSGGSPTVAESTLGSSCWGLIVDGGYPISSRPIRSAQEVYAIEVFRPPDIPPEFEHWTRSLPGQNGATPCAIVVMWSMREAQRSVRPPEGEKE